MKDKLALDEENAQQVMAERKGYDAQRQAAFEVEVSDRQGFNALTWTSQSRR